MENKICGELKKRALLAKQRLKLGYWEQLRAERERLLKSAGETDSEKRKVSELQRAKFSRELEQVVGSSSERDEQLYKRVQKIQRIKGTILSRKTGQKLLTFPL